jgi:Domain found in Dishevelled, Egl-10, and Pleckstrin (DEP)
MPVKSHRHFLRNYEDTFTGAEAAVWFLNKLQNSNHFDFPNKNQVIALLDKFLKSNVFEPVLGDKTEFKPNNTLYQYIIPSIKEQDTFAKLCICRFPSRLPLRSVPLPNLMVAPPAPRPVSPAPPLARSPMKRKSISADNLDDPKLFLVDLKAQAAKRQKNALDTERVWETILFGRSVLN